jgi:uncharacterized repeat protein (TIGR04076 family)
MEEQASRRVKAKVISQKGTCVAGHRVGTEFTITDNCPADMCAWAFYSGFPFCQVLMSGGSFPWDSDPNRTTFACPDPSNPVVFELTREK